MQWRDVVRPPSRKHLRQFAGLFLAVFLGLAAWRWFTGRPDVWAVGLGVAAVLVGITGLVFPAAVRPVYTGWMVVAFPIGWTVSRVVLAAVFFLVVTPVALVFRIIGRDALHLRQRQGTYWTAKAQPSSPREYLRQS